MTQTSWKERRGRTAASTVMAVINALSVRGLEVSRRLLVLVKARSQPSNGAIARGYSGRAHYFQAAGNAPARISRAGSEPSTSRSVRRLIFHPEEVRTRSQRLVTTR